MTNDKTISRVRTGGLILMIGVAAEMIRYVYTSFDRALTFSFWDPTRWNTHNLVDPDTVISIGSRIGYFAIWGLIIVLSVAAFLAGLYLLNFVRQGKLFHSQSAAAVSWLGLILAIAMIADLIFHAIDPWLITRANADPLPIRWGYDPSDIKTLIMALILFLFGWVMRESIQIEQENSEYV